MYAIRFRKMAGVRWLFNIKTWNPTLEDISTALSMIETTEKSRILEFVFKKDAKASLAGRLMMRKYASEYLDMPWNQIEFGRSEKGKPFVVHPNDNQSQSSPVEFNLSHQGSYCAFAGEGRLKIGTDIMEIDKSRKNVPEFFRLMRRQFSSSEWEHIYNYKSELEQLQAFYRNWCLKESYVKCSGTGISVDLQAISFTALANLSSRVTVKNTTVNINGNIGEGWIFEETLLEDDHIFTVAFNGKSNHCHGVHIKYLTFNELISNSLPVSGNSINEAKAFIEKPEAPWAYK